MSAGVVSAHLDDAVLSASAVVATGARVVTVFAGVPPAGTPLGSWDALTGADDAAHRVRERHLEDERALAALSPDAVGVRLGFLDGQHLAARAPQSTSAITRQVVRALDGCDEVLAPAAVGAHPDHVQARDAATAAARELGVPLRLYADVPYSVPSGWPPAVDGAPEEPCLRRSVAWEQALETTGLDLSGWRMSSRELDRGAREAKLAALACYATQMPALEQGSARIVTRDHVLRFEVLWSQEG